MSDSVENLAEIERMDAEDAVDPTPQSVAPAPDFAAFEVRRLTRAVQTANERLRDLLPKPCADHDCREHAWWDPECDHAGCTIAYSYTELSSESPALDDEEVVRTSVALSGANRRAALAALDRLTERLQRAEEALALHDGHTEGLVADKRRLETALQLAQGALGEREHKLAILRGGAEQAMSCSHHETQETCDSIECIRKDHHMISAENLLVALNGEPPEVALSRNALPPTSPTGEEGT